MHRKKIIYLRILNLRCTMYYFWLYNVQCTMYDLQFKWTVSKIFKSSIPIAIGTNLQISNFKSLKSSNFKFQISNLSNLQISNFKSHKSSNFKSQIFKSSSNRFDYAQRPCFSRPWVGFDYAQPAIEAFPHPV